ncbi:hypothetical protein ABIB38_001511 [Massilia sp. UYP11]|uniref:hypothetical protein n=1 Tax=Massilia sp. UYP11 TaxID=1756385 RepID=UPI003D23B6D3
MIGPNDVVEFAGTPGRTVRVLWIDQALAWTYQLGGHAVMPEPVRVAALEEALTSGQARRLLVDPFAAPPPREPVPQGYLNLQAKAWSAVRALHADRQALVDPRQRTTLMAGYAAAHGMSKSSILRYLRRYWERGQTPDALLPDYGNSGAPGRTRAVTAGIKRGRPRKGAGTGTNADERMRAIFHAAAARYAASHDGFSRRAAYRQMLEDFFQDVDAGALPSFGQFNYWLERDAAMPPPVTLARPAPPRAPLSGQVDGQVDGQVSGPVNRPVHAPSRFTRHAAMA